MTLVSNVTKGSIWVHQEYWLAVGDLAFEIGYQYDKEKRHSNWRRILTDCFVGEEFGKTHI